MMNEKFFETCVDGITVFDLSAIEEQSWIRAEKIKDEISETVKMNSKEFSLLEIPKNKIDQKLKMIVALDRKKKVIGFMSCEMPGINILDSKASEMGSLFIQKEYQSTGLNLLLLALTMDWSIAELSSLGYFNGFLNQESISGFSYYGFENKNPRIYIPDENFDWCKKGCKNCKPESKIASKRSKRKAIEKNIRDYPGTEISLRNQAILNNDDQDLCCDFPVYRKIDDSLIEKIESVKNKYKLKL